MDGRWFHFHGENDGFIDGFNAGLMMENYGLYGFN
jgi:hypothetical protein